MKSTTDTLKSIKAQVKYMIDNQYHATRCILHEQNDMFCNKRLATEQTDSGGFFDSQIAANSEVMRYLDEVRDCLTEAIDTPVALPSILNSLGEEARKGNNEWILDMFLEVIQYMDQLKGSSTIEHPSSVEPATENVLRAA